MSRTAGIPRRGIPLRRGIPSVAAGVAHTQGVPACDRCGEDSPGRARFCWSCGAAIRHADEPEPQARKVVTVLFSDLADSTGLGERNDPEAVRNLISSYFEEMSAVLERHGGTVEKFIGDAVMAVFGHPLVHEDDAVRAVRAAAEMGAALSALNARLGRAESLRLRARIGINTGEVVVGGASSEHAFLSGDAVNTAKRLEEVAAPGEVLLGRTTLQLVRDAVQVEAVEPLALKGKRTPVVAYRLLRVDPAAPGVARRLDSPLVGRTAELAVLRETLAAARRERRCRLVLVSGAAGIGKTRLALEFLAEIRDEVRLVRARCHAYGEGIALLPAVEVVREAAGLEPAEPAGRAREKLVGLFASSEDGELVWERLAGLLGLADAHAPTEEIFWAVRRLLETLAQRQPLVVLLDDVHWAEPTLLDLLEYLAGWSRSASILLCCLVRPDLFEARPGWAGFDAVSLPVLSDEESRLLVRNLAGERHEAELEQVVVGAAGNPLFLEQLVAMLGEESGPRGRVPPSIQALLAARLDRLADDERVAIERAAVVGPVFTASTVAELAPDAVRPRVAGCLRALVRRGLLRPAEPLSAGEDAFGFAHVLIREAAYAGLTKELRAELHERLGSLLERRAESDEVVGYHLEQAVRLRGELGAANGQTEALARRAGELLAGAGERASARADMGAAAGLLDRAVALLPQDDPRRLELLNALGAARRESGDLAGAEEALSRAIEESRAAGDRRVEASAELERSFLRSYSRSDDEQLLRTAERVSAVFGDLGDELGLAKAWNHVAFVHFVRCRYRAMEEVLERAAEHARRAGNEQEEARSLRWLAAALALGPTPAEEAIARCEELLLRVHEHHGLAAVVQATLARLHAMRGRFDLASELYATAKELASERGLRFTLARLPLYAGPVELIGGDDAGAERELRQAQAILEQIGEQGALSTVAALLARALCAQGRFADAEPFTELSERTATVEDAYSGVMWRGARARVLAQRDELAAARSLAEEAVGLSDETDGPNLRADALLDLVHVLEQGGATDELPPLLERAESLYRAKGNTVGAGQACRLRVVLDGVTQTR